MGREREKEREETPENCRGRGRTPPSPPPSGKAVDISHTCAPLFNQTKSKPNQMGTCENQPHHFRWNHYNIPLWKTLITTKAATGGQIPSHRMRERTRRTKKKRRKKKK